MEKIVKKVLDLYSQYSMREITEEEYTKRLQFLKSNEKGDEQDMARLFELVEYLKNEDDKTPRRPPHEPPSIIDILNIKCEPAILKADIMCASYLCLELLN